ncbi:MAG: helix-turn-helix transcriptional regulator [Clostridia bacterium]|nr:helix-turn-helix transcriptional regulator [Clostridia bacterium]
MYGKSIKKWRTDAKISQIQLSKATGIPQNTISWIESDEGIPNVNHCKILAEYYGITIDELIGKDFPAKNW